MIGRSSMHNFFARLKYHLMANSDKILVFLSLAQIFLGDGPPGGV